MMDRAMLRLQLASKAAIFLCCEGECEGERPSVSFFFIEGGIKGAPGKTLQAIKPQV